jgi:hypothetical protein
MAQMALAVSESADVRAYHYFSPHACVLVDGNRRTVFVGGTLVSSYEVGDKATRNAILVKLSEDPKVHLGKLVEAFELSREQLRNLQKKYQASGLVGVMKIKTGGRQRVVHAGLRRKLYGLFDKGTSISVAHAKIKNEISRTMVGRTRKAWRLERELEAITSETTEAEAAQVEAQLELGAGAGDAVEPANTLRSSVASEVGATDDVALEGAVSPDAEEASGYVSNPLSDETGLLSGSSLHDAAEVSSELIIDAKKQHVQHAGALIVLALLQASGFYRHAEHLRSDAIVDGDADRRYLGKTALRVALDAAVIALVIGQRCIEGVRRIATPSAKTLLRVRSEVPSETWVRGILAVRRKSGKPESVSRGAGQRDSGARSTRRLALGASRAAPVVATRERHAACDRGAGIPSARKRLIPAAL